MNGGLNMTAKNNISELTKYYKTLNLTQKREFILNLKEKLKTIKSPKHSTFLEECIKDYNSEIQKIKSKKNEEPVNPNLSDELFAKAIASMLGSGKTKPIPLNEKIAGKWIREENGKTFYFIFDKEGNLETNDVFGHDILTGHYNIGIDGIVLMEPHELLQVKLLSVTNSGKILSIVLNDGKFKDYKKVS